MATQSSHEAWATPLAPSTHGEPAAGNPCDSSPDPNMDSGEALEKQGDQPESPNPGLHDNLPPQGPNPEMAEEENNDILGLSFPRKLWRIMEDLAFTSVHWNGEGDMVVIKADRFQTEVLLCRGMDQIFETDSIKSFIYELKLYGFIKICPLGCSAENNLMIYHNSNFQRDKPLLLQNILKRKKRAVATRHSPRLQHNLTPSRQSFVSSYLWSMGSVAGRSRANHLPSEQGGPSGKGMSSNATSVQLATSGRESTAQMPESPPEYPACASVMALYNTCSSILMVALSVTAPKEAPSAEEEQGESSDYKCVLCEQVKDKPNP
ncbi:hypothetical protein FD755_024092 [Muntiacus reevesi]|uniref:HSF-type DNA-binding domain-containing protein n=1 Tax=Muntiacus reevesi TaxID=9886 RepID=A0A5N3VV06_MUNRE|nr:hypothetical protein FD755_024093 [Muntiacus reevesi]KAB0353194.1 hypothetical protein FD755_024092 [Muntiacus reevesi]